MAESVVVNVEKVMEEIRREIQMEEALRELPKFEDIPLGGREQTAPAEAPTPAPAAGSVDWPTLSQSLDYINRNYDIPYYWSFQGSRVKVFLKRVVRRLAKCILAPIVAMQNTVNTHVVRCCNNLKEAVVELMARTDVHQSELARLRGELDELRRELERQQILLAQQDEVLVRQGARLEEQEKLLTQQDQIRRKKLEELDERLAAQGEQLVRQDEALTRQGEALVRQDETLAQQDEVLARQGARLEEQEKLLTQQDQIRGKKLEELDERLAAQGEQLVRQDEALTRQGEALAQQDEVLIQQKQTLEEQSAALTAQETALTGTAGSVDALSGLVRETQDMLQVNDRRAAALERDMDCIRRLDESVFSRGEKDPFHGYSQSGEDGIIANMIRFLGYRPSEVSYLDLGANHARELSNTYYFYAQGASGVLVEANPNLIPELKLLRYRDTVLNRCVSDADDEEVEFHFVNGDGLSSKSKESVENAMAVNPFLEVTETTRVKTVSVNTIMERYFPIAPVLLNIDLEGSEMDVLSTWDFDRYRPMIIVIETIPYAPNLLVGRKDEKLIAYLQEKGYAEYAFTGINSIFVDKKALETLDRHRSEAHEAPTDYFADMQTNELASRMSNGICLRPGGVVYGPYITCPAGDYRLSVKLIALDRQTPVYLDVMAETGTEQLGRFRLSDGENDLSFSLGETKKRVEFVLHNETKGDLYLTRVFLQ